jgi:hypothetical protein
VALVEIGVSAIHAAIELAGESSFPNALSRYDPNEVKIRELAADWLALIINAVAPRPYTLYLPSLMPPSNARAQTERTR